MGDAGDISDRFDEEVDNYNNWFYAVSGNSKIKKYFAIKKGHPIYNRKDLTPAQKDAILLASDIKRAQKEIFDAIGVEGEGFVSGENFINNIYSKYRRIYFTSS